MDIVRAVEMPPFGSRVGAHLRRQASGMGSMAAVGKRCWSRGGVDGALDCERDALTAVAGYEGRVRGFGG